MTTRGVLAADIDLWLARSDLSDRASSFIRIAEATINRMVRVQAMETTVAFPVTEEETDLPADFVELVALVNPGEEPYQYRSPLQLRSRRRVSDLDYLRAFTIEGDRLVFPRAPDNQLDLELAYLARFPALTEDEDSTNWLLINNYDIYLYLALAAAAEAKQDAARSDRFREKALSSIEALHRADSRGDLADFSENRSVSAPTDFP